MLVIAIDQAEELFTAENAAEATQLLEIFPAELARVDDPATIVVFGIDRMLTIAFSRQSHFSSYSNRHNHYRHFLAASMLVSLRVRLDALLTLEVKSKIDPRLTEALLEI